MTRLPAFAVDGAVANGRLLRTVAYAATSGQSGVVTPDSMKVTASGSSVAIAPGSAVIPTRYSASPAFNSYVTVADAAETLAIPPTGSGGGATRYVIARVDDPEYGGQADPSGTHWYYDQVGSITALPYPFIPLAKIVMPASTTNLTNAMITDLRDVATPRKQRLIRLAAGTSEDILTASAYTAWPSWGDVSLNVPEWATRAFVRADIAGARIRTGAWAGRLKMRLGNIDSNSRVLDYNYSSGEGSYREDITIADEIDVTEKRGQTATLRLWAYRSAGSGTLTLDSNSSITYDVEFAERAV